MATLGLRTCIAERDRLAREVDRLRALLVEADVIDLRDVMGPPKTTNGRPPKEPARSSCRGART